MYRGAATFWTTRQLLRSDEVLFVEGLPRFRRVLVANGSDKTYLCHASKHLRSNIGTPWVVAKIFNEQFFVPVWSREARLYRNWRNGKSPN
jgi:hypothetical protein